MKQVITIIFLVFIISCSNQRQNKSIEGEWRYGNSRTGCEIGFKSGIYTITRWDDDVVNTSKGQYYINRNPARNSTTVTLAPDLQYSNGDTIILPCEFIDIVNITDSTLETQKPTQWIQGIGKSATINNSTRLYRKVKQ